MLDDLRTQTLAAADKLKAADLKVATAESCTGGGLCYWLTSVPGSSDWVERGFVTYSNQSKIDMLGVPAATLDKHGAVSRETACAMAEGALKNSQADIAISITGVAGPDGGSPDKPIGTVWIGWTGRQLTTDAELYTFQGGRQSIRMRAMVEALKKIISIL